MESLPSEFKLAMRDNAMAPEYPEGALAIFSTVEGPPRPRDAVLVRDRNGHHYLREYRARTPEQWQAVALDPGRAGQHRGRAGGSGHLCGQAGAPRVKAPTWWPRARPWVIAAAVLYHFHSMAELKEVADAARANAARALDAATRAAAAAQNCPGN